MTQTAETWPPEVVARIQEILDRTAATAGPEVARVFARPDWRLSAAEFLAMWTAQRWCTVASVGPNGQPHIAIVHADFQPDGRLTMRMFTGSVRARDIAQNPRVALAKHLDDGAVAMVYGTARPVPGTEAVRHESETVEVEIAVRRIYAMRPVRE
ncbi:pyridoxamine 5'-phosphate oxidase family protein [Tepidiforma thermophila]|uniref:Pyridoxamine 5'-phosphate oxidase n=1 Tax=Tepidiforma thermophila (strain KCTC 52669 / CGMCC 1.13589 / G233) TaxID=2761530 RepID=A0A2A9HC16_TEPT2|nr:pyridoxamine 5'-phosphate oxidase family protein [Tepidiforma thermophila]PFG73504.1 pyridoxamine 5'-phosphate oxidase [Tepidiforma thermophila]